MPSKAVELTGQNASAFCPQLTTYLMMLDVTQAEIEREVKRALPACGDLTTCHPLTKGMVRSPRTLGTTARKRKGTLG